MSLAVAQPAPAPEIDPDALYEVVNGIRVELPPMGAFETGLASDLLILLGPFTRRRFGRAVTEMLFLLDPETGLQRRPDVAYVTYARWPRHRPIPQEGAWPVVPDLAVEVVSPTNTATEVLAKVREYFLAGVRLAWVVYPQQQQVYVYTSPTAVQVIDRAGTLDGGDVVPGFQLPLAELFEHPQPEAPAP